jgi:hypothetical protein
VSNLFILGRNNLGFLEQSRREAVSSRRTPKRCKPEVSSHHPDLGAVVRKVTSKRT